MTYLTYFRDPKGGNGPEILLCHATQSHATTAAAFLSLRFFARSLLVCLNFSFPLEPRFKCCLGVLVGIHSENVANEPPVPPVDLLTHGIDVSLVTDLFIGYFHRPIDLHYPSQILM